MNMFTLTPKIPITADLVSSVHYRVNRCVAVLEIEDIPFPVCDAMKFHEDASVYLVNSKSNKAVRGCCYHC
jgi:hypothetical protein